MKNKKRNHGGGMLLTLCPACARQFYDSDEYILRRVNRNQKIKDTCSYCGQRQGWDFSVRRRGKK